MTLPVVPPPQLETVAKVGPAPASVNAILRRYAVDHPNAPRMTASSVTRLGKTRTTIRAPHKFGDVLDVTIADNSEAMVLAAAGILDRASQADGPRTHLRDPGPDGRNAPAPVEDAPRDVVSNF